MDIKELKKKEPFWQKWKITENGLLGEGSFGAVYQIQREDFQFVQEAALKVISIPKDEKENEVLLEQGMSREEIQAYYYDIVKEIYEEISCMALLKGKSNIISYEDYDVLEREDSYGYFILIRMELATGLPEYLKEKDMQTKDILKLGLDLSQALLECQKHQIIHRDIKPANIFVSADGDYKLGDFGVAKIIRDYEMDLSVKGSYSYMAPEIYYGKHGDARSDLYSLGLVLYMVSNQERLPFLDSGKLAITYSEKQQALQQRMHGENPQLPQGVPKILGQVINRAIAFEPEQRYASVEEFYEALKTVEKELFGQKESLSGIRSTTCDPLEKTVELFSDSEHLFVEPPKRKKKNGRGLLKIAGIAMFACFLGGLGIYSLQQKQSFHSSVIAKKHTELRKDDLEALSVTNSKDAGHAVVETPKATSGAAFVTPLESISVVSAKSTPKTTPVCTPERTLKATKKPKIKKRPVTQPPVTQPSYTKPPRLVTQQPHTEPPKTAKPAAQYATSMQIPGMLQLGKGRSVALPIEVTPASAKVTVSSSNTSVVRVQGTMLYAQQAGRCDIRVSSGNLTRTCTIKVTEE